MAISQEDFFKKLTGHCKEYGFIYQSSEIYDGLGAVYDYGPLGVELKNNIKTYWWNAMTQMQDNIVGLDSAIFMHPLIWKASGHVDAFNDPLIDNKDSKKRYRADVLIEEYAEKQRQKAQKEIDKARTRFGDSFDEEQYKNTNDRVKNYLADARNAELRLAKGLEEENLADIKALIEELGITCEVSGSKNWTDVRQFNLMFSTQMGGAAGGSDDKLYLRPETAQGIFVNFLNVQKSSRMKIPFGIAQIGKAFRNEIVARQFIFRMREFEQMEMQFFVRPGTQMQWYEYWKAQRMQWHLALGTESAKLRFKDHDKVAHYADAAVDIQFEFPFGMKELEGIHSRTDFDLKAHQELSGKKMMYFDPELNESYVPYVVETSVGCDRMFLSVLSNALLEEAVPDAKGEDAMRTVLKIHPALAPIKCAILPLLKNKEELTSKASEIFNQLKLHVKCQYDEKDAIGRRYRRQDAIGTPYCVTIDFETLEDGCVTLRDRDTLKQDRVKIEDLSRILVEKTNMTQLFV
jgi:glycyl-tRNA synthetase